MVADDILEIKGVLSSSHVFEDHLSTKMDNYFFWKLINVKCNIGSVRDHDKTTVLHSEHEVEVIDRLIRGESCNDAEREDDDDLSDMSNDESICPNRTEGVTIDNNSESDGDKELTDDKHATKSALALKKLSNMSRKKMDVNATTNIMVVENLLIWKKLAKARTKSLCKQQKTELIFNSMQ